MPEPIRQTDWPLHWPYLGRKVEISPAMQGTVREDYWTETVLRETMRAIEAKGFTTHLDIVRLRVEHDIQEWPHDPADDDLRARLAHTILTPDDIAAPQNPGADHYYRFPAPPGAGAPARIIDGPRAGDTYAVPEHPRDPIVVGPRSLYPDYYWPVALNTATGEWLYAADDVAYRAQHPFPKE